MPRVALASMVFAPSLLSLGCTNPPPQCATRGDAYSVCSENEVWQCPTGPADVVAFNLSVDAACDMEDDPVQCILDAEYRYVDMTFRESCGDQVCVEDRGAGRLSATCEDEEP